MDEEKQKQRRRKKGKNEKKCSEDGGKAITNKMHTEKSLLQRIRGAHRNAMHSSISLQWMWHIAYTARLPFAIAHTYI